MHPDLPALADSCHAIANIGGFRQPTPDSTTTPTAGGGRRYLISVSILNIGKYIEMMITPTIMPTPIIMIGSMIEVSV
jgi:hypothetical protein